MAQITIALAGNPNCGKTTLFNALTGSNQYVGNWPGVTVEKKDGRLKGRNDVVIQDLPGIYSLSPYTLEEVVARGYLVKEKPDAILNIVDGTNIERNLYLTTQLMELGIPVVVAVNMIDLVRKNGDTIDLKKLSRALGCPAVEISALKGEGCINAAQAAITAAQSRRAAPLPPIYTGETARAIESIEALLAGKAEDRFLRWYAVKLFERDEKVQAELALDSAAAEKVEQTIAACEEALDDDAESIITNQRYQFLHGVVESACTRSRRTGHLTVSDKIDRFVTNRVLALPIFAVVMLAIYTIAMGSTDISFGTIGTDWVNDVLFGEIIPPAVGKLPGVHRLRPLAGGPHQRRHRGRRGGCPGLCAPDPGAQFPAGHPGGRGLHGPHRLCDGPDLPPVRPVGQELHPPAGGLGLRHPRGDGLPHH